MAQDDRIGTRVKDKDGNLIVVWPEKTVTGRDYTRGPTREGRTNPQPATINLDHQHFVVIDVMQVPGYKAIVADLQKKVKGMADAPKRAGKNDSTA